VRFPVFANDLRDICPTEVDVQRVQKSPNLLVVSPVYRLQLALREASQEAASGLAIGSREDVDALQERIGD